jgi:signal transduction histidine kinase/CheY-like chemotaxis protein
VSKQKSKTSSLEYRSFLIFALGSLVPLFVLVYAFYEYGMTRHTDVAVLVAICLSISALAYSMGRQLNTQVSSLLGELAKLGRGPAEKGSDGDIRELAEIKELAGSFGDLLGEMRANTHRLEDLIYKLSSLSELTELASRIPDSQQMLQVVLQRTMAAVDATIGSIMLVEPGGSKELRLAASQGHPEDIIGSVAEMGRGIAGTVAADGETVLVEDIEHDPRFSRANDPRYGNGSFICMPLKVEERVIGVINLARKGNHGCFEEADVKFLHALMNHISFALEHGRLLREAKEATLRLERAVSEKANQLDAAQRQVVHAEKLSALGELIAGIVHELNNPLTGIMGYSQLLLQRPHDRKNERDLQRIFEEARRASRIVHNLLSFARLQRPEKHSCQLNDLVGKVVELRSYDLKLGNILVECRLAPALPPVLVDETQLQQVVLNLVNNAQQAIAEKGADGGRIAISTRREGEKVLVAVSDDGPGIPPGVAEKVFDPFFTTKEQGKGTGLGLSISYGIVREHGGQIYYETEQGKGSTFYVELPVMAAEHEAQGEPEAAYQQPSTRLPIKRVLVVDDEEVICDLVSELLGNKGYTVDRAVSAKMALDKISGAPYDLVLCDVRMPGMDGSQLYEEVRKTRPEVARRFVFATGDVIGQQTQDFLEASGTEWLSKPFTSDELLDVMGVAWQRINAN